MAELSLVLFGSFRLAYGEGDVPVASDKARALLAYLAIESGHPQRRETLTGLLWPEYPEGSARHSLSQTLSTLNGAIASVAGSEVAHGLFTQDRATVRFTVDACRVDAVDFAVLLSDRSAAPDRALGLYHGDLMAGFTLRDCPEFEEWLIVQRERCRRMASRAASLLALQSEDEEALRYARLWVDLDPLDEAAHRRVMVLLAGSGHRSLAVAQYEACRRFLRAELGVPPDEETQALYERIRQGLQRAPAGGTGPVVVRAPPFLEGDDRYRPPLFVSRESELARLEELVTEAVQGHSGLAFVAGEAGCGKTALVQALARRTQAAYSGLVVATGHCNAHTGIGDPYLAFREILAQLSGDVADRWAGGAIDRDEAGRLWALVPQTCQALTEAGPDLINAFVDGQALLARARMAVSLDAPWLERLRELVARPRPQWGAGVQQPALFQQVTAVLQRVAQSHPLLLVLEDLHWADAASLSLLFHLGLHLAMDRVLIVGTFRPADLVRTRTDDMSDPRHPLEPVLNEFQRRQGEIIVDLGHSDGRRLIDALLDSEPNALDGGFREALHSQSGGNALFATELLRALRERGDLRPDTEGRWSVSDALRWDLLPARVGAVIAERIGRLPAGLQEALRVASVEGETFTAEAVALVLRTDPQALVRSLSEDAALRHGLIAGEGLSRRGDQPLSKYRFRHILIQNRLYDGLDAAERAYLHGAMGDALLTLHSDGAGEIAVQLARHYEEAGSTDRAITYLRLAGIRAWELAAYQEAAAHYTRAQTLLETLPASLQRDEQELDLINLLANSLQATEGHTGPRLHQACLRARELSGRVIDPRSRAAALGFIVSEAAMRADWRAAQEFLEEGLGELRRSGARAYEAGLRLEGVYVYEGLGELRHAVAQTEYALSLVDAAAYADTTGARGAGWKRVGLQYTSWVLAKLGYPDQAMAMRRQVLDQADTLHSPQGKLGGLAIAGAATALTLRLYDVALEAIQAERCLAEAHDNRISTGMALAQLGGAELGVGRARAAIAHLRDGIERLRALGFKAYLCRYMGDLAEAQGLAGDVAGGLEVLAQAESLMVRTEEWVAGAELGRARGDLLLLLDPPDEAGAEAAYLQAIAVAQLQGARLFELRSSVALARLLRDQGRSAEGRALVQPVYDWFTEGFDTPVLVDAREFLAETA